MKLAKEELKPLISRDIQNDLLRRYYRRGQQAILKERWYGERALIEDQTNRTISYGIVRKIKYDKQAKDFYFYLETKKPAFKGIPVKLQRIPAGEVTVLDW